jgi:hypothetical protein
MNTNQAIETVVEALDNGEIQDNKLATAAEIVVSVYRVAGLREANKDAELAAMRAENARLREALEAITERAEQVSESIHVEKRSEGVSQAAHVRHMANHLAQHAKIARTALEVTK